MVLIGPSHYLLMSAIAEGRVRAHFTVAKLVVSGLAHVEVDWAAPRQNPLALSIANRVKLGMAATTPCVLFTAGEVHMCRENTSISWHARWAILSFLVRPAFHERHHFLLGEVCHVLHRNSIPRCRRLKNLWLRCHNITLMGFELASSGTTQELEAGRYTYSTFT